MATHTGTLYYIHCKKELAVFPSPAGMSLIKLFLGGNNLVFSRPESLVSDILAGDGKMANSFLQCRNTCNIAIEATDTCDIVKEATWQYS